jgi:hypothetical protein
MEHPGRESQCAHGDLGKARRVWTQVRLEHYDEDLKRGKGVYYSSELRCAGATALTTTPPLKPSGH